MPAKPNYLKRAHPAALADEHRQPAAPRGWRVARYAELRCKTNFSFLRGASHPEELIDQAAALGLDALAITDRHSLAGIVRAHCAARSRNLPLVVGAEIHPVDAPPLLLHAMNRGGYAHLCRILTAGRRRVEKGACAVRMDDVTASHHGLIAVGLPDPADLPGRNPRDVAATFAPYRDLFGDRFYLAAQAHGGADDDAGVEAAAAAAGYLGAALVAVNDVHYHVPQRRFLQDVLTCIRRRCTITDAGRALFANAERHLKTPAAMQRLFAARPGAVLKTLEIAGRCRFHLDELRYEYPEALCPPGREPHDYLAELAWAGARERYPRGVPGKVRALIEHELALVRELKYEPYFLTVWDIVRFARSRGILCQGRGSAANSAVCYCLGITSVDPDRIDLLFERFVSAERNEPPDIDVDFEHERREEVFRYIYDKYDREHAGIVAEVITYRPRSAIRDVGKVLGLSLDRVAALAGKHDWWRTRAMPDELLREAGFDPDDRTVRMLVRLVEQLLGFPRHLSQHVGGFVITRGPLCDMVPIENGAMPDRTFIQWDKDDIDAMGMLKIDCLALGMLSAIRKCLNMIGEPGLRRDTRAPVPRADTPDPHEAARLLAAVPPEDPAVYDMICRADTVGVFQIESRAQMSMLPRLRPRNFYDLVIEVAIVRPGPIQGGMVHPYLRRRNGEEPVTYPSESVRSVLERTLGVPLFQEQAMRLAIVAAGFSPGEADRLRRAMAGWRRNNAIDTFRDKLISGMIGNGLDPEFAERCFQQICGFGEYGFPESHAASFALLVYVSCWLKRYHPAAFCAAVINAQPMGFYHPAQLVRDAREHGVTVRPVDVNHSGYDCTLEPRAETMSPGQPARAGRRGAAPNGPARDPARDPGQWGTAGPALRLGIRLIRGISRTVTDRLEAARRQRPFDDVNDLARRSAMPVALLARLAAADAMRSMGLDRRQALWDVLALANDPPMYEEAALDEPEAPLPVMTTADHVYADYDTVGLSLLAHPISLVRSKLRRYRVIQNRALAASPDGRRVRVAGLVLVRQRPATASGITFATIEDETASANLVIRPRVFERYRKAARASVAVVADGRIERVGDVVHVQVHRIEDLSDTLRHMRPVSRDFR